MENIPARRDLLQFIKLLHTYNIVKGDREELQGIKAKFALPSIGVPERNVQDFWPWITVLGRL